MFKLEKLNLPTHEFLEYNYVEYFKNIFLSLIECDIVNSKGSSVLSALELDLLKKELMCERPVALCKLVEGCYTIARFSNTGPQDRFGYPTSIVLNEYGSPLNSLRVHKDNFVILKLTPNPINLMQFVTTQANLLSEIDLTIFANLEYQKTPYAIGTSRGFMDTIKRIIARRRHNAPGEELVYNNEDVQHERLDLSSTFIGDELLKIKMQTINQTLSLMGVSTSNIDKKSNLTESEVDIVYDKENAQKNAFLYQRHIDALQIKQKFDLTYTYDIVGSHSDNTGGVQ